MKISHQEIDNLLFPTGRGAYYGGCTSVLLLHVANESYLKRSEKNKVCHQELPYDNKLAFVLFLRILYK